MDQWTEIRKKILVEGVSKRQVMEKEGIHWETLRKILENSQPPGYQMKQERPQPKIGPFLGRIQQILQDDKHVHKKQRHTAKRIFERLKAEDGYTGGYTQVKKAVRGLKRKNSEVFVPLTHRPGEAQVDFGHACFKLNGVLVKRPYFVMALPYWMPSSFKYSSGSPRSSSGKATFGPLNISVAYPGGSATTTPRPS